MDNNETTKCPVCGAKTLRPAPGGLCAGCAYGDLSQRTPSKKARLEQLRRELGIEKKPPEPTMKPIATPEPKQTEEKPMRECVIEGCKKLATARGLCANHYQQWITRKKPLDEDGKPDLAAILAPAKRGPKSTASKQAPLPKPQPEPPAQAKEQHPLPTPPKLLPLEPELDGDFWRLVGEAEKLAKQLGKHCRCFISVQCKERNFHITFEEGRR